MALLCGLYSLGLYAQGEVEVLSDLTSRLVNADFSADEPVPTTICTYDYDMEKNATTYFGQQVITGWTASNPSDNTLVSGRTDGANAKAAGIFALLDMEAVTGPGLGSAAYIAPYANTEATEAGVTGPLLGVCAVWGAEFKYTQDITLPAGDYMLVLKYYNVGAGEAVTTNYNGFVTADGKGYYSAHTTFPKNVWEQDTVIFRLTEETAGAVSIGLKGDGGSAAAAHIFYENVKLYSIATNYLDQVEIDKAKEELLALIEKGNDYEADTSASQAVYDNPDATLQEVLDAIEAQKAINDAALTDLSEFFIKNPHFSEGEPITGGICTYLRDKSVNSVDYYGSQPIPGWTATYPADNEMTTDPGDNDPNGRASGVFAIGSGDFLGGTAYKVPDTMSDGSTEGNLLGMVTCWSKTVQYTQDVILPAGKYIVGISYYNTGGANAVNKSLIGFVDSDGREYLGETKTFPVNKWTSETIVFTLDEETPGYFTLGYTSTGTGSGNMPHLFVDGFSLIYIGTGIDPSKFALQAAVTAAEKLLNGDDRIYSDLRTNLENAVSHGRTLMADATSEAEDNMAATEAINGLVQETNTNIKAYRELDAFYYGDLTKASEKYTGARWTDLATELGLLSDDVYSALQNTSWTTEEINTKIASLPTIIKTGVKAVWDGVVASGETLDEPLDITDLFDQLTYIYSTTAAGGDGKAANVPDKDWAYGTATNFKTQYGTAEVWNQSPFTVSTTLSELPAGTYTITTKAFYRNADNESNYSNYDASVEPTAFIFARNSKAGILNLAELATDDETAYENKATVAGSMYVPNSQADAYAVFNNPDKAELVGKSVSTALTETGELNLGVTATEMSANCWVVWYGFQLSYNALGNEVLAQEVEILSQQLTDLRDELSTEGDVANTSTNINEALGAGEDAIEEDDEESLLDAIAGLKSAIAETREAISVHKELTSVLTRYRDYMWDLVESEEPNHADLVTELDEADGSYESIEQMKEYIERIKLDYVTYVQYPCLETASETNMGDMTPVVFNAGFYDITQNAQSAEYWDITYDGGSTKTGGPAEDPNYEFYNSNSFQISQTIKGLAEGYYRIRVQSFYRAGTNAVNTPAFEADQTYGRNVELFGTTETNDRFVPVRNVLERAEADGSLTGAAIAGEDEVTVAYNGIDEFTVPNGMTSFAAYVAAGYYWNEVDVFVGEGETLTLGLRKAEHIAEDWCILDNFQFYYLGTTAPTAIEAVDADIIATGNASTKIYNIAGQRVAKAVKGLYIVNGKKVLVK